MGLGFDLGFLYLLSDRANACFLWSSIQEVLSCDSCFQQLTVWGLECSAEARYKPCGVMVEYLGRLVSEIQ